MTVSEWDAIRARIKPQFEAAGITRCEIRFLGCTGAMFLGFAHAKKRRNLTIPERSVVVLACSTCHDFIEAWPEPVMENFVLQIISRRPRQPSERSCLVDSTAAQDAQSRLARLFEHTFRPTDRVRQDWDTITAELARLRTYEAQPSALALAS